MAVSDDSSNYEKGSIKAASNQSSESPKVKSIIFDEDDLEDEGEYLNLETEKEEENNQAKEWSKQILSDAFRRSIRTGLIFTTTIFLILVAFWPDVVIIVQSGQMAVQYRLFNGGVEMDRVYDEGIHFIPPWNELFKYNIRVQEQSDSVNALSKDGLDLWVNYTILYKPRKEELPFLHKYIGMDYVEKIVNPMTSASIREVISQFRPHELYSLDRNLVQELTLETLLNKAGDRHVEFVDVMIRSIVLPPAITAAIETKLVEEQKELMFDYKLIVEEKEARRKLIEARGIKTFSDSAGIDIMKWRGLEVTEALSTAPNSKVVVIGTDEKDLPIILGGN